MIPLIERNRLSTVGCCISVGLWDAGRKGRGGPVHLSTVDRAYKLE